MTATWGWAVAPCRDGRHFVTTQPYSHRVTIKPRRHRLPDVEAALKELAGDYIVWVPEDFEFDGSSTPRFLWSVAPPMTGKHTHASLLHDWLYEDQNIGVRGEGGDYIEQKCSKELADLVFLEVMRADGMGRDLAETMWGAVKNHGRGAWKD